MEAMRRATAAIIAIDARDTVLLVYAMVYMADCNEVCNCFRGCIREFGTGLREL